MSFVFNNSSLSAIKPVKLTYKFNNEEKLSNKLDGFANGFSFYTHELLKNHKDSILSKRNALFLTDIKDLSNIFDTNDPHRKNLKIGKIGGTFYLKLPKTNHYLKTLQGLIFRGGAGEKLLVSVHPLADGSVYLKTNETTWIQADKAYPYTFRLSQERLDYSEDYRRRFFVEYDNGLISFKTLTVEGYRYLSFGKDLVVRGVGLMLNETVVNPYLFELDSVSLTHIEFDYVPKVHETKYYNDLNKFADRKTVNIKDIEETDTHLIVSLPTYQVKEMETIPVNIALAKTYFTPEETYITSILRNYGGECATCACDYSPKQITRVVRLTSCGDFLDTDIEVTPKVVTELLTNTGTTSFIFEYTTRLSNELFQLPIVTSGSAYYDFYIDWGDGNKERFTGYNLIVSHYYSVPNTYIITVGPPP